ncbi:MAG: Gfo/Idh/MocA family oxidoreductase [Tannerellaceae bacterium]|nr:Gfo/Idh/MocA family oxidoreductase [Tannerellaceae bacterium]
MLVTAPDHWHAPATIMACQAGKHVYVEKPCSHSPGEGELSIAAARKYNRIVQVLISICGKTRLQGAPTATTWFITIGIGSGIGEPAKR